MTISKPSDSEIQYWRNERTRQQAILTEEKAKITKINRQYMERRFIPADEVLQTMTDCQTAIGVVAGRVAKGKPVNPEHVGAIYDAIQPLCGELLERIIEKIKHPKIEGNQIDADSYENKSNKQKTGLEEHAVHNGEQS